jgi:hypothetical protein
MNSLMNLSRERFPRLILEAAALFVAATFIFDATHYALHVCLNSRWPWLRKLASSHGAHHAFCDRRLIYHDDAILSNLTLHVIPEYVTQMAVCAMALIVPDPLPVFMVMGVFTLIFLGVMILRGKDRNHVPLPVLPVAHGTFLERAHYHALHHIYPDLALIERFRGLTRDRQLPVEV